MAALKKSVSAKTNDRHELPCGARIIRAGVAPAMELVAATSQSLLQSKPKKGVWNFQRAQSPAFIGLGEFQTPFFGQRASRRV
jgi:hypothetical protein